MTNDNELKIHSKESGKEELTSEDKKLQTKSKRTPEQIKEMFLENYTDEDGHLDVDKMVEREQASSKVVSTLIGQKKHFRNKAEKAEAGDKPKEGDEPKEKKEESSELKTIKEAKRKEATENFINDIKKKYPDMDVKDVHDKVNEVYEEDGTEISAEDFSGKIDKAFKAAYPKLAEDEIRKDERKKLKNELPGIDFEEISSKGDKGKDKVKGKNFFPKKEPITDWFKDKQ